MTLELATNGALRAGGRSGPLLFARFAAPPNVLGYCGGTDHGALVDHLREGVDGAELVALCRAFEGAWPYLQLIADSAGVEDPLDPRVVEAYWIGNPLLDRVRPDAFRADLTTRFSGRTERAEWRWLAAKPASGGRPHHAFHVLEVMPRIGLLREGRIQAVLPSMGQCLVRPATVVAVGEASLTALARPLVMSEGRLELGPPAVELVADASGGLRTGDRIAVHWSRSCGRLTEGQSRRLAATTTAALRLANETT